MKLFLLTLAMIGLPSAPAPAPEPEDPRCSGSNPEMIQCGSAILRKADEKLNASYQAALKRIEATTTAGEPERSARKGLIDAQRLWIQFREKDCGAVRDYTEGWIGSLDYLSCMADHADRRAKELDASFNE